MPDTQTLRQAALDWAAAGFHVFPVEVNGKRPATPRGLLDATLDPTQINTWWAQTPYNIGVAPSLSGMTVVDVDGPAGAEALARLEAINSAIPSTLKVQTPRGPGHTHIWLQGTARSTVGKLGPKIDTRGEGGYVLVPPSQTAQGAYEYVGEDTDIAEAPAWLLAALAGSREGHEAPDGLSLDLPHNIQRALAYLAVRKLDWAPVDPRRFQVACGVRDFGLSREKTLELLKNNYNPYCNPINSDEDLKEKVDHAYSYAQNSAGAYGDLESSQETFAHIAADSPDSASPDNAHRGRFRLMDETEMANVKPSRWLIRDIIQEKSLALMYGKFESYKSFLALDLALTLAAGVEGWGSPARDPVPVVYAPSEGQVGLALQRKPAWRFAHGIETILPFYSFDDVPSVASDADMVDFIETIRAKRVKPALVVIDTVANSMTGLDEDTRGFGVFIDRMKGLRKALGCAILAVHHVGKDAGRGPRGGNALPAGFDTLLSVEGNQDTRSVAVYVEKQKDHQKRKVPFTFQGDVVMDSLVFNPIEPGIYKAINSDDDTLGPASVFRVLTGLGATSPDCAVPTPVVAAALAMPLAGDDQAALEQVKAGISIKLNALGKSKLAAYVTKKGRDTYWSTQPAQVALKSDVPY